MDPKLLEIGKMRVHFVEKLKDIRILHSDSRKQIENDIFELTKKASPDKIAIQKKLYIAKCQQIYMLLKQKSYINKQINIDAQKKAIYNIVKTKYTDLCKYKWDLLEEDIQILDKKIIDDSSNIYTTSTFKCHMCKKNKCIFSEVQIKSCDENTTIFVRCLNCGYCFHG